MQSVNKEQQEILVSLEVKDSQDLLDCQDQLVVQAVKETLVPQDKRDKLVCKVQLAQSDLQAVEDNQVLLVLRVTRANKVAQALQAIKGHKDHKVRQDHPGHKVHKVQLVRREWSVALEHQEEMVNKDRLGSLVGQEPVETLEPPVSQVRWVLLVHPEIGVLLGQLEEQDYLEILDLLVRQDRQVELEPLVPQDHQVFRVRQVLKVQQVRREMLA